MGIISQQFHMSDIPYSNDQPDGGYSGQPYIKHNVPELSSPLDRVVLETAKFTSDFPQRGGLYAVRAAAEDAIRIRKFLTDFPQGSNFTYKQVGLQKSNPLIETGKNGGRINTRTYNLNSNLLFSTLNAGNGFYPRMGATPFTLLDEQNKYSYIVSRKSSDENRLVNLYKVKIQGETISPGLMENLGISPDEFEILNYTGGPGSLYGDGDTIIGRATDNKGIIINTSSSLFQDISPISLISPLTTGILGKGLGNISDFIKKYSLNPNSIIGIYEDSGSVRDEITNFEQTNTTFKSTFNTIKYDTLIKQEPYIIGTKLIDFRTKVENSGSIYSRDYTNSQIPMITRIGIGSPGARPRDRRIKTGDVFKEGQDLKNLTPIYYGNFEQNVEKDPNTRDLIKFSFETIDNNNINNTYRTHFRAFLKGFSDSNTADWDNKKYSGRGENMYTYQGFDRSISFSFVVSAQSKQEMKPLWQKMNYLHSTLCPDYSPGNGFMRGNIHRLTIGEYLYRTPGIIKSLNFSIDDQYPWEIKMDEPEKGVDDDMMELPQLMNVSVTFVPILSNLPRTITRDDYNITSLISHVIGDKENFIRDKNPFQNL